MKWFIALLGCVIAHTAWAEMVPPAPRTTIIERTIDRMALPSQDISIWDRESGGYDTDSPKKWGRNSWVCESSSNSEHGKCNTTSHWGGGGQTTVPLQFTEQRSGMKIDLNLIAYNQRRARVSSCGTSGKYQIYAALSMTCGDGIVDPEAIATAYLPATELQKLPVGGIWHAELHLNLRQWDPSTFLAAWTAQITLNITDPSHVDIYFPEFGTASPRVDLDLHPHGSPDENPWAADTTTLDMCLYDGYNANSTQYNVLLRDEQKAHSGRADGDFSVYRVGGDAGQTRDRVDYHVRLRSPETGSMVDVSNNQEMVWTQINQGQVRPVRLPAIPNSVLCSPSPLELSVKKFSIADKNAGYYQGTLTVVFTPTTPTVD